MRPIGRHKGWAGLFIFTIGFLMTCMSGTLRSGEQLFWRGVYLFGIAIPDNSKVFFSALSDSLHLNIFQVRTHGFVADRRRNDFFLRNPKNLKVINQSMVLAAPSGAIDTMVPHREAQRIRSETKALAQYPNNFRFYLADEPDEGSLNAFASTSKRVKGSDTRAQTVTALLANEERFVSAAGLSEVLVETYFLKNNTPHPSLVHQDSISSVAGIVAWADSGYGWYLGGLQQQINEVLATVVRPAAEASFRARGKVKLIFVPQLHGVLDSATKKYDRDNDLHNNLSLRPPSPAEIRLQYNLGLAYGAKGFLAYPYGFDTGYEQGRETYPGLVSGDPSQVNHSSNFDTIYGRRVWTGYNEKWHEVAAMNKRLEKIDQTLIKLQWLGTKSWTMEPREWKPTVATCGKWTDIVTTCSAKTVGAYRDDLPQVEIGHLRKGEIDYIVVVNRRCAKEDTAVITITFRKPSSTPKTRWKVTNIETNASLEVTKDYSIADRFQPGEGKIYRINK